MANIAIILSGGTGSRLGSDIPKQYLSVGGQPVIDYCLLTFLDNSKIDKIIVVLSEEWHPFVADRVKKMKNSDIVDYAASGETRQYSIYNGLKKARSLGYGDSDIVIIHDAARPLCSNELIDRCIRACGEVDGVMPAVHLKDTVYQCEDGLHITALLERDKLRAGQAPEAFHFGKYLKAHEEMPREDLLTINGSTEIAYKAGLNCVVVEGDPMNIKITTPEDLIRFESILLKRKG